VIYHVDDCLIFTKEESEATALISELKENFLLTDEGTLGEGEDVSSYLGVQIKKLADGKIELTQPYLIACILEALGRSIEGAIVKQMPVEFKTVLHKDEKGPERKSDWNYGSVVGMLSYLTGTWPDILYAVHSCARFSISPKLIHEQAVT
jgi:Reverse transcriptase (RNA-dependent DNA polymerase).